jgi:hypothetical protein
MKKDWIDTYPPSKTKRALIGLSVLVPSIVIFYLSYNDFFHPGWINDTLDWVSIIIAMGSIFYLNGLFPGRYRRNFNNKDWE